ncbi:hypothetical protein FYK55_17310 [Roseiconus nitratireducens]|uniref:Uncharacterized protein n=1 Tax=Roseiconus nitratireducens TaxID=2605748 RepID=A0A5M6D1I5_9BACT|nr:hypothetical protein [Roseiconus nitratireducens]KAA5541334.1 hypothetical protein FYK55_17310 [Roseiconus nitratireducens]
MKHSDPSTAEFLRLWERWTNVIQRYLSGGKRATRISAEKYRALHDDLMRSCRQLSRTDDKKILFTRVEHIAEPWVSLEAFSHADRPVLKGLLRDSDEIFGLLGRTSRRRIRENQRRFLLTAVVLGTVVAVLYLIYVQGDSSLSLEVRRLFRRMQFAIAKSNFLQAFSVLTLVVVIAGIWLVNSVKKS